MSSRCAAAVQRGVEEASKINKGTWSFRLGPKTNNYSGVFDEGWVRSNSTNICTDMKVYKYTYKYIYMYINIQAKCI